MDGLLSHLHFGILRISLSLGWRIEVLANYYQTDASPLMIVWIGVISTFTLKSVHRIANLWMTLLDKQQIHRTKLSIISVLSS